MWQLILGPVLGIIGSFSEKFFEHKQAVLEASERQKDRDHDLNVMKAEGDLADKRLRVEGEMTVNRIDAETFGENYKNANTSLVPKDAELTKTQLSWVLAVEIFCKLIRPCTTVMYQVGIAAIFGWAAWNIMDTGGDFFSGDEFSEMFKHLVYSIIGLAETTLLWWYGIRRMSKKKNQ